MKGFPVAVDMPFRRVRPDGSFGKDFNTEEERGPRRATETASGALRARRKSAIASDPRYQARITEISGLADWDLVCQAILVSLPVHLSGRQSSSVLKIGRRTRHGSRRFGSKSRRPPLLTRAFP